MCVIIILTLFHPTIMPKGRPTEGKWVKHKVNILNQRNCYIYKRPRSSVWQYYLQVDGEGQLRRSTGVEGDIDDINVVKTIKRIDIPSIPNLNFIKLFIQDFSSTNWNSEVFISKEYHKNNDSKKVAILLNKEI